MKSWPLNAAWLLHTGTTAHTSCTYLYNINPFKNSILDRRVVLKALLFLVEELTIDGCWRRENYSLLGNVDSGILPICMQLAPHPCTYEALIGIKELLITKEDVMMPWEMWVVALGRIEQGTDGWIWSKTLVESSTKNFKLCFVAQNVVSLRECSLWAHGEYVHVCYYS